MARQRILLWIWLSIPGNKKMVEFFKKTEFNILFMGQSLFPETEILIR